MGNEKKSTFSLNRKMVYMSQNVNINYTKTTINHTNTINLITI